MSASLDLSETVDLVGPKGYEHGFIYVGGPGLPSVSSHNAESGATRAPKVGDDMPSKGYSTPGGLKAGKLQRGDKVMGSFEGGPAGLKMHDVVGAKHTSHSVVTFRNTRTGTVHTQKMSGAAQTDKGRADSLKPGDKVQGHFAGHGDHDAIPFHPSGTGEWTARNNMYGIQKEGPGNYVVRDGRGGLIGKAKGLKSAQGVAEKHANGLRGSGDAPGQMAEYEVTAAKHVHSTKLTTRDPDTGQTHTQVLPSNSNVKMSRSVAKINAASKRKPPARALANEGESMTTLDFAAPKLGSGARFRKLSTTLAARGASDPDALAAWIGRRKYGSGGMGRLSHGKGLANPDLGIYLSEDAKDDEGHMLTCPECNYSGSASEFGFNDVGLDTQPEVLRTPAPSTGSVRDGAATTVRSGNAAHALANTRHALEFATGTMTPRRHPIQGPLDVLVARQDDGTALLRHRNGGAQIASLRKDGAGKWVANVGGRDLTPRDHQRTALMEAVGTWNKAITGGSLPASGPLQAPPEQTELMAEYGIPAIRALATPSNGASDGPRMTTADAGGDDGTDGNGLTAKGQAIYRKLLARGFPEARALAFAKNSQKFGKAA